MKKNYLLYGLCLGVYFILPGLLQAQWESDVRLTIDTAISRTSFNNAWCVATSGKTIHVVWKDSRDNNEEIYYKMSTNSGLNWGMDMRLTNNTEVSASPSVAASDSFVHVVWTDTRDGNYEIYYKRSTNAGRSWEVDTRLTNNSLHSWNPSVCVSGSVVHVVWEDNRDGNYEIYTKRSTDAGINWSADTRLTNNSFDSWYPSVAVSGSSVHVVWRDRRDGNWEIYYKRSTDAGVNWGSDIRLTNQTAASFYPSIAVSGSVVHVVWEENRNGNPEIYYKRSTDAGATWGTDTRLTNDWAQSLYPSLAVSGSVIHVVWEENRDANPEIYYKRSTDAGVTWESDTRLTNNSAHSLFPSVAVSDSLVHVVWMDERDGNKEIYYKRNPTGNAVVGIKEKNLTIPNEFSLSQNFPNPFNPNTTIRFEIPVGGFVRLTIFNSLGQEISVLVNEELRPGIYEYNWHAADLPSGVYIYRLQAGSFTETKKMILMK